MTAYLDHAATTPVLPVAARVLAERLAHTGNPSSLHAAGRAARRAVEESREELAGALGARPSEVLWTSGGTEADNLAVKGLYWARRAQDSRRRVVVVSSIEHHAVLDPALWLERHDGAEVVHVPVDREGTVRTDALAATLAEHAGRVALVSVMLANNEVGTVQPVPEVVALAAEHGVPVHCDAVQAVGQMPVDFGALGVDALTVSSHKAGGPGGVGALLVRRDVELVPVLHGGGQERGVRSGTLDAPLTSAFAAAVAEAVAAAPREVVRRAGLRDRLVAGVLATVPGVVPRGTADPARRLPGNAHLTFAGCEGDSLLYLLDAAGVEASTGSACQAGVPQPSHVLLAMGVHPDDARGALRFSLGHTSTDADVDRLLAVLPGAVERARAAGLAVVRPVAS